MLTPGESTHTAFDAGWVLPEPEPREAVATRSVVCRSFRRRDGLMDIDGRFIDTRPFAYDNDFRGHCPEGSALHNMQLRLTLDKQRTIVAVQLAMASTPYEGCQGVMPNFQRLVGQSVGRGFKRVLREQLAGTEGCTHILALLEVMAAAAVQAYASANYAPKPPGSSEKPVRVWKLDALVDTCFSYKAEGPVIQRMRQLYPDR